MRPACITRLCHQHSCSRFSLLTCPCPVWRCCQSVVRLSEESGALKAEHLPWQTTILGWFPFNGRSMGLTLNISAEAHSSRCKPS